MLSLESKTSNKIAKAGQIAPIIIGKESITIGCQKASGKTNRKTRTVCDGISNVARKYRNHKSHSKTTYIFKECGYRCAGTETSATDRTIAHQSIDQKGDRC